MPAQILPFAPSPSDIARTSNRPARTGDSSAGTVTPFDDALRAASANENDPAAARPAKEASSETEVPKEKTAVAAPAKPEQPKSTEATALASVPQDVPADAVAQEQAKDAAEVVIPDVETPEIAVAPPSPGPKPQPQNIAPQAAEAEDSVDVPALPEQVPVFDNTDAAVAQAETIDGETEATPAVADASVIATTDVPADDAPDADAPASKAPDTDRPKQDPTVVAALVQAPVDPASAAVDAVDPLEAAANGPRPGQKSGDLPPPDDGAVPDADLADAAQRAAAGGERPTATGPAGSRPTQGPTAAQQAAASAEAAAPTAALEATVQSTKGASDVLADLTGVAADTRTSPTLTHAQPVAGQPSAPAVPLRMDAIALKINQAARAGETQFQIRLDPPELGRIDVKLDIGHDGQVKAHLTADRQETLDMLQRDARALHKALETTGLKLEDNALQFSMRDQGSSGRQDGRTANTPDGLANDNGETDTAEDIGEPVTGSNLRAALGGVDRLV
ncbi:MAG: flagellar hook-length control protein FliK [Rhodobiaceae bacterium]|nr:flagellar hook-length control protein FliK [Rhodobiaceae bacterium]